MDSTDKVLVTALQGDLPLVPRVYAAVGERFGLSESEVLKRVERLKESSIIRQIGPIFDSRRLGYVSTLCALSVEPERLDEVAAGVSAHTGVSHNYSRDHAYNLWFTLTLPGGSDMDAELDRLAAQPGVTDHLSLPALRVFKIGVHLALAEVERAAPEESPRPLPQPRPLTAFERQVVRATQGDLPTIERPFLPAASLLGVTEEVLLQTLRELHERGALRRFSAVLRHRQAGFTANGMACWIVPEERIEAAGRIAASFEPVSHCYQRPAHPPRWPYSLFAMLHGRERDEVGAAADRIGRTIGVADCVLLSSTREYKKERVRYFEDD